MSSSNKAALKAAKAALDAREYEKAATEAKKVLAGDPDHYHANIFLGLALERGGQFEEAEKVYDHAVKIKDDDSLVWQGLIGVYEKQANKKIDAYAKAVRRLSQILMKAEDQYRCQPLVDKYVGFVKQHGTKKQYKEALELMLPTSEIYDYLEGRLPHPGQTYPKIAEIVEAEEKQRVNKLIGERRTRLGAKIGQVTNDAKREVYGGSPLEGLYQQVIDWTNEDDLRRLYEEKLLQRAYEVLSVLPLAEKPPKRQQVQRLAEGMVIIKHPLHLAWKIVLEWKDVDETKDMDGTALVQYMELFPDDGLTKVLSGWFRSDICPFPKPESPLPTQSEDPDEDLSKEPTLNGEDQLIAMTEGLEESARSILSQRLMAEYYLHIEEYASAAEAARKGSDLIQTEKDITGLEFQNNIDAVNIVLATALVHYQTPRHHGDARRLFESVLSRKAQNVPCLIGLGLILEEEEDFEGAVEYLTQTLQQAPNVKIKAEAAWCKALAGDNAAGLAELRECLEDIDQWDSQDRNFKSQLLYRLGMCLWHEDTSKAARKDRTRAYAYFLASLQSNLNNAPAYTSLGIYYNDYAKDRKRARKCFQKAFELSASEVEAAERLARSFADRSEWDLVEVVAQRVIDSGKTRPPPGSKKPGLSWPYAALGICQINNLDFAKSIVSFQSALRTAPNDAHSWIGLGESYRGSGRYLSATKAFQQVQLIQEQSASQDEQVAWFARYMLASVEQELGQYETAIDIFNEVLLIRPKEFGVTLALLQTQVDSAWHNVGLGLFGRASSNASQALDVAGLLLAEHATTFNLWKAVGDASSAFSWIEGWATELSPAKLQSILQSSAQSEYYSTLAEVDGVQYEDVAGLASIENPSHAAIYASILAHKRAIFCASSDIHAQAVAWYNLGWIEYRAHTLLPADTKSKRAARPYLKASVRCLKRAIELEAGNAEFWNFLGIVTTSLNPKVAQHAFVRSLYLNGNSAKVWTNLGTFYLLQNDYELASEALNRGQSTDPDYAPAWLGQGLLELLRGELAEANNTFSHAFEIADSAALIGKRLFASTLFDHLLATEDTTEDLAELLQPLFALLQLKIQAPADVVYRHLSCLFSERIESHGAATEILEGICADIEGEYEESEAQETLVRFAQAKADLARAYLAAHQYEAAAESAETALDLSSDESSDASNREARLKCRLSAHLTAGLAYNYLSDGTQSIAMFRTALTESSSNPDAVCVLAQVLWAKGGDDERHVAREQLFDCIEHHPEHARTIMLLAVIAVLDSDAETLDAVAGDLHGLRAREDLDTKEKLAVARILAAAAHLKPDAAAPEDAAAAAAAAAVEATTSTMMAPNQPHGWTQLAELAAAQHTTDEEGTENFPAQMALLTALGAVPPRGKLAAEDLGAAFAGTGRAADAQRAVMLAPWQPAGWEGLAR